MLLHHRQMAAKRSSVAPITVYTNGNKYDSKRFIFNPKYVRTFDALLDQITTQTNATCAVRKIYTPHGSRQVGSLSSIKPGGEYVAVSSGNFQKIQYGKKIDAGLLSEGRQSTNKPSKTHKIASRFHRSYEDQIKTQKTIYVYRNGLNESPTQIFFTKRLLRSLGQVLDVVQEKMTSERAIVRLHKLNGVTINDVNKLQAGGRYVAVEQGQKFRYCAYDYLHSSGEKSPRRVKLPAIGRQRGGQAQKARYWSASSSQESNTKLKIKLPVIKQKYNNPGFHIVYGYPDKFDVQDTRGRHGRKYTKSAHAGKNILDSHAGENTRVSHAGPFYASGAQMEIGNAIRDDKRVRVEKPLDLRHAEMVEEQLDSIDDHGNDKRNKLERRVKPITGQKEIMEGAFKNEKQNTESVTLHKNIKVSHTHGKYTLFPTKPSIAHPRRHAYKEQVPKSMVKDQRLVSNKNKTATTKRYTVTREQNLFGLSRRDGLQHVQNTVNVHERCVQIKGLEREKHELEKRKRIEDWVEHTVEAKQRDDEIASVAKQLVTSALANARKSFVRETGEMDFKSATQNKSNFCESSNQTGIKYHRVFGQ